MAGLSSTGRKPALPNAQLKSEKKLILAKKGNLPHIVTFP
jgi:hypothetical protein